MVNYGLGSLTSRQSPLHKSNVSVVKLSLIKFSAIADAGWIGCLILIICAALAGFTGTRKCLTSYFHANYTFIQYRSCLVYDYIHLHFHNRLSVV